MRDRFFTLFVVLICFIIAGCKTSEPVSRDQPNPETYQRQVNPFPVYGDDGSQIDHPFLGGFNAPRPQFVDIDGDGDPDLFVQENTDDLMFFKFHVPDSDSPLEWQSDKFHELDIGEWFRFVDMDQDGDYDLLTEQPYSYIRYYRNIGTAETPEFILAADSLKDVEGTPIFSDRQNIPNVTDIDCDEKLDLFIGRLDGTLTRYESVGRDEEGTPRFELVTKNFEGIEIVKEFGSMHGANTMTFADIDDDGDQDLFWGDFFEPSILLLENTGSSCSNPQFRGDPQPFPASNPLQSSGYNAPSLADWGLDGDLDLFLGVLGGAYNANHTLGENFYFYEQNKGGFSLQSKQFLSMIDIGDESIPAAGDLDGDGDTDLLLANKIDPGNQKTGLVYRYENKGTNGSPEFYLTGTLELPEFYHYAPALADLNGDGLADLLIGNWRGDISYYRNTGNGFELVIEKLPEPERRSNAVPGLGDIDNDGDIDLLVGESGGGIQFFRNTGTSREPEFSYEQEAFPGVSSEHRSAPALTDIDGDGDLDLFLGSKVEGILFYRNTGTPGQPVFRSEATPFPVDIIELASPLFADLDGDGIEELISGSRGGGVFYYKR